MLKISYEALCGIDHIPPILLTAEILAETNQEMVELRTAFPFPQPSASSDYNSFTLACSRLATQAMHSTSTSITDPIFS